MSRPIDLSKATAEELDDIEGLRGHGFEIARCRTERGRFSSFRELSPREREMLELICEDLTDATISERLGLSRNTVRNHIARLYAKIGVNRRSAAVIWGRDRGLGNVAQ